MDGNLLVIGITLLTLAGNMVFSVIWNRHQQAEHEKRMAEMRSTLGLEY